MKKTKIPYQFTNAEQAVILSLLGGYCVTTFMSLALYPENSNDNISTASTVLLLLPPTLIYIAFIIMRVICKRKVNNLQKLKAGEIQDYLTERTENCEKEFEYRKNHLIRLRRYSDIFAGALIAFSFLYPYVCALTFSECFKIN